MLALFIDIYDFNILIVWLYIQVPNLKLETDIRGEYIFE